MQDITALMALVDERDNISTQVAKLTNLHQKIVDSIKKTCFHPTTIKKSTYHSGGYDYKSETNTYDKCTICGAIFNQKTVFGSYQ